MSELKYKPIFDMSELGCVITHHGGIDTCFPPYDEQPHWELKLKDGVKIFTTLPFGVLEYKEEKEVTWPCPANMLPQDDSGATNK
jgi:hypothetical protein